MSFLPIKAHSAEVGLWVTACVPLSWKKILYVYGLPLHNLHKEYSHRQQRLQQFQSHMYEYISVYCPLIKVARTW